MCAGRDEGSRPIFQNGDNSALRGLGMLLGSLGELLGGCTKRDCHNEVVGAVPELRFVKKSWERWL